MELSELKYVLDKMYGFDISRKTRIRSTVYAKKVFIQLAKNFGYGWTEMKPFVALTHDNCIFHYKSFGDIKTEDLVIYNACIDYFNLPMEKIPAVESINESTLLRNVIFKIKGLGRKDLKYFDKKVLDVFLAKLKYEKEIYELNCKITSENKV